MRSQMSQDAGGKPAKHARIADVNLKLPSYATAGLQGEGGCAPQLGPLWAAQLQLPLSARSGGPPGLRHFVLQCHVFGEEGFNSGVQCFWVGSCGSWTHVAGIYQAFLF